MTTVGKQLFSTLADDGTLTVEVAEASFADPVGNQVLVKMEAAPINPSDLALLFGPSDLANASYAPGKVVAKMPEPFASGAKGRHGQRLPVGNEGAGTVVAAGEFAGGAGAGRTARLLRARPRLLAICNCRCDDVPAVGRCFSARRGFGIRQSDDLAWLCRKRKDGGAEGYHPFGRRLQPWSDAAAASARKTGSRWSISCARPNRQTCCAALARITLSIPRTPTS